MWEVEYVCLVGVGWGEALPTLRWAPSLKVFINSSWGWGGVGGWSSFLAVEEHGGSRLCLAMGERERGSEAAAAQRTRLHGE